MLRDLRAAQVDVATIGQYLQPTRRNLPVAEWQVVESATKDVEARLMPEQKNKAQALTVGWQREYTKRYLKSLAE